MSKLMAVAFLLLVASSSVNKEKEKDKHTAHFDGLILTVTAIDSTEAKGRKVPVPARSVNPLEPGHVPVSPPPPPPPPPPPLEPGPDHHYLAVFVNVKNAGKNPACMSFSSLLKTTFG